MVRIFIAGVFDTGATDHISFCLKFFTTIKHIHPIPVSLPNGAKPYASISGTICLSKTLLLHNVLYLPHFNVNLISVAKLIKTNNCRLTFTDNVCHILQNRSKRMIGTT